MIVIALTFQLYLHVPVECLLRCAFCIRNEDIGFCLFKIYNHHSYKFIYSFVFQLHRYGTLGWVRIGSKRAKR